jgi:hypothetical protein
MKEKIHPKLVPCKIICNGEVVMQTYSTKPEIQYGVETTRSGPVSSALWTPKAGSRSFRRSSVVPTARRPKSNSLRHARAGERLLTCFFGSSPPCQQPLIPDSVSSSPNGDELTRPKGYAFFAERSEGCALGFKKIAP